MGEWQKLFVGTLVDLGLSHDMAMLVMGKTCDLRQKAYMQGYERGWAAAMGSINSSNVKNQSEPPAQSTTVAAARCDEHYPEGSSTMSGPSQKEIENAKIILEMLGKIEGITVQQIRDDVFLVSEPETELEMVVDVEETTVCFMIEVATLPLINEKLLRRLLEINNTAVHGAFCLDKNIVLLKENLEIENIDLNEVESAIEMMFLTVAKSMDEISDMTD